MELSIAMVSRDTRECLRECLQSIRDQGRGIAPEAVLVDDASSDGSAEMVGRDFPWVKLLRNRSNEGFSAGTNKAIRATRGQFVLLLNTDMIVLPGSLQTMLELMRLQPEIGVLSCQLLNTDGSVQHFCRRLPGVAVAMIEKTFLQRLFPNNRILRDYYMRDWHHDTFREVEQPPGCCLLVRRDVLDRVGLLDERMFLYFSDVDFCRRVREAGFRIFFTPEARIVHHHGVAGRKLRDVDLIWQRDRFAYFRKHSGRPAVWAVKAIMLLDFFLRGLELCCYLAAGRTDFAELRLNLRHFFRVLRQ